MAQTALSPTRVQAVGSFTTVMVGCAGGSGTSTVVTLPGVTVINVGVSGATSATAPFCATISGSTFTVTTASNDLFTYWALVRGGV